MKSLFTHSSFMSYLPIVNTAVFVSVAFLHAVRLAYQSPVVVGSMVLPLWLSVVAIVGASVLAYLNWQSLPKRSASQWLQLLLALLVIDVGVLKFSFVAGLSYWGLSGDTFLWVVIIDVLLIGIILQALRKRA